VPNLAPADWLILLIYGFFMLTAGFSLKPAMTGTREYMQAGRALPGWLCGFAFVAAGLGLQAPLAMGLLGAKYGFESIPYVTLGAVPAMLFLGLFMMPLYFGSNARTVPEFLALRFDEKTRLLNACLFLISAVTGAALALYTMGRVFKALEVFDGPIRATGLGTWAESVLPIILPAALVLAYVLLGGLAGTAYNLALQFLVFAAGFLPAVLLGLKQIGGWSGLKSAAALAGSTYAQDWNGAGHGKIASLGLAAGLGLMFGACFWCTDFRLLQTAMAAKDVASARRAPLIAAAVWVLMPLLLVFPGLIAAGLPTPRTTIVIHNENGAIYHDITVVPPAVEAGQGLVPAEMDAESGKPLRRADGRNLLDYAQAAPNLLVHFLPIGLLGLGIAALLACMMAGVAAGVAAFSAVFTCDLYQMRFNKSASDRHLLAAGRWTAACGLVLAVGLACASCLLGWKLDTIAILFARINTPLLATMLLGMFWKRTTGHGAFAGLAAGVAATFLPSAILLPFLGLSRLREGWIAALVRSHYQSGLALSFWTALAGFAVSLLVTAVVSVCTKARPEEELEGLVHSLRERPRANATWWKRPEALAGTILLAAIAVNLIFL
jgi:SSS family solute:Na+ symporter